MYRGSRKHVLDWVEQPTFLPEFAALGQGLPVGFDADTMAVPSGHSTPDEARLETFGPEWQPGIPAWKRLAAWWLRQEERANTPNWDLLLTSRIEGRSGLVLVEAKANGPELSRAGKPIKDRASTRSQENHEHIAGAIRCATDGWQHADPRVTLSRDSHYQLANRLAFTWKLV